MKRSNSDLQLKEASIKNLEGMISKRHSNVSKSLFLSSNTTRKIDGHELIEDMTAGGTHYLKHTKDIHDQKILLKEEFEKQLASLITAQ